MAALPRTFDLGNFDAKAPPTQPPAFLDIVDANRATEDAELADLLEGLGNPRVVTLAHLLEVALFDHPAFADFLRDRKHRRNVAYRLEAAGYVSVRNTSAKDGLWKVDRRRQAVYGRRDLPTRERLEAATTLARGVVSVVSDLLSPTTHVPLS